MEAEIPSYDDPVSYTYLGCYGDNSDRIFSGNFLTEYAEMTTEVSRYWAWESSLFHFVVFIAQDLEKLGDFKVDSASSGSDCSVSLTCNAKPVNFMTNIGSVSVLLVSSFEHSEGTVLSKPRKCKVPSPIRHVP